MTQAELKAMARKAAGKYGVPFDLFKSVIGHESGWDPKAVSPAGARGLGQLMPVHWEGKFDPFNPRKNLNYAAKLLAGQYKDFGSWKLALAAYNAGAGAVKEYGGVPPFSETEAYVRNILAQAGNVGGLSPSTGSAGGGGAGPTNSALENFAMTNLSKLSQGTYDPIASLSDLVAMSQADAQAASVPGGKNGLGAPLNVPGTGVGSQVVRLAAKQIGQDYVWGGDSRAEGGFDCSGLVYWAYQRAGINIGRIVSQQVADSKRIRWSALRPGDLIAANDNHHIVMYAGGGRVIAAPRTGEKVQYQPLSAFKGSGYSPYRVVSRRRHR